MRRACAVVLVFLFAVTLYPVYAAEDWVHRNDSHPSAREDVGMAYIGLGQVLLFGGEDYDDVLGDTWVYDLSADTWTLMSPASQPTAREGGKMAYIGDDQVLLFGGYIGSGYDNDTWVYDLSANTWTEMSPASQPAVRYGPEMAHIGGDQVVLFGGSVSGVKNDETWVYDLSANSWTQMLPASKPSARYSHAMAHIGGDQVVLFGGYDTADDDETWIYDLSANTWTQMSPASRPSARTYHAMAYLGTDQAMLFGGSDGSGYNNETWVYDLSANTWVQDSNTVEPIGRETHDLAETSLDGSTRPVLFGGWNSSAFPPEGYADDTWFFGGGDYVAIELSSFIADAEDGIVTLWWATESEDDNLGFYVYRSTARNGVYERLTDDMIPGVGTSTTRHEYTFTDEQVTNGVTYWYKLQDVAFDGNATMHGPISATPGQGVSVVPNAEILSLAYPNPMATETSISYRLHEPGRVRLGIYDLSGHEIRLLVSEVQEPGRHAVTWDGMDDNKRPVASGIYLYRFEAGEDVSQMGKAVLLR